MLALAGAGKIAFEKELVDCLRRCTQSGCKRARGLVKPLCQADSDLVVLSGRNGHVPGEGEEDYQRVILAATRSSLGRGSRQQARNMRPFLPFYAVQGDQCEVKFNSHALIILVKSFGRTD